MQNENYNANLAVEAEDEGLDMQKLEKVLRDGGFSENQISEICQTVWDYADIDRYDERLMPVAELKNIISQNEAEISSMKANISAIKTEIAGIELENAGNKARIAEIEAKGDRMFGLMKEGLGGVEYEFKPPNEDDLKKLLNLIDGGIKAENPEKDNSSTIDVFHVLEVGNLDVELCSFAKENGEEYLGYYCCVKTDGEWQSHSEIYEKVNLGVPNIEKEMFRVLENYAEEKGLKFGFELDGIVKDINEVCGTNFNAEQLNQDMLDYSETGVMSAVMQNIEAIGNSSPENINQDKSEYLLTLLDNYYAENFSGIEKTREQATNLDKQEQRELKQGDIIDYDDKRWHVDSVYSDTIKLTNLNPLDNEKEIRASDWKNHIKDYALVDKKEVDLSSLTPKKDSLSNRLKASTAKAAELNANREKPDKSGKSKAEEL